jgi:hypothetical protein
VRLKSDGSRFAALVLGAFDNLRQNATMGAMDSVEIADTD